jgi:hypothetical protein
MRAGPADIIEPERMDLEDIILAVQEKERRAGYDGLSQVEQVVCVVSALEAEVNSGGLDQFFFNSAGDRATETIAALHSIGAHAAAAIVEEACALFPAGRPSSDRSTRQRQLLKLDLFAQLRRLTLGATAFDFLDVRFYAYPDRIGELLLAFFNQRSAS